MRDLAMMKENQLFIARLWKTPALLVIFVLCLVFAVSVSSFFLWQHYSRQQDSLAIPLHPGWKQITVYSGTGNKTIVGQSITLPNLWGEVLACKGQGKLDIDVTGNRTHLKIGNDVCSTSPRPHESPQLIEFDMERLHIQELKIVASADITWRLQFVQETKASLPIDPTIWMGQIGMSGTSDDASTSEGYIGVPVTTPSGQTIVPKIWGLLLVCLGKGTGSVQLVPSIGTIPFPPCDGTPRLHVVRYPLPTSVQEIQIKPGHITSYVGLLACIDEQKCTNRSVS